MDIFTQQESCECGLDLREGVWLKITQLAVVFIITILLTNTKKAIIKSIDNLEKENEPIHVVSVYSADAL